MLKLFWNLLFLSLLYISNIEAQFVLHGKILDSQSNSPVIGAVVSIVHADIHTLTDFDGKFRFDNAPDTGTIRVHLIGYVEHKSGYHQQTFPLAGIVLELISDATLLNSVEVTGKAEGQIRALIDQRNADNIKNIVSAEQIATFPDLNAAEVLQRIPGITLQRDQGEGRFVQIRGTPPQLTNFNINGEQIPSPEGGVRYVGMDIIPADQIEFIEVSKVMTPDMDADGIGGSVNIRTKEAAGAIPDVRASLVYGYNHLRQTPTYQGQMTFGQRYGRFGFQINGSYYKNIQGSDNVEYDFAKGPFFGNVDTLGNYHVQFREVQLRHYDLTRTRISVAPTIDYKFSDKSFVYIRAMYNHFGDYERRYRKIYELDDALSYDYYLYGSVQHDVRDRIKNQSLQTISMGGEHPLAGMVFDYQLFLASAKEDQPDRFEASFDSPGGAIAMKFSFDDQDYPTVSFPNPNNAGLASDYDRFELGNLSFESRTVTDINITPRINLKIPYIMGANNTGFVKVGGKIRMKNKERDIQSQQFAAYFEQPLGYPGVGPALNVNTINDGFSNPDLLHKGYVLDHMPSPELLKEFYEYYPQHFVFDRTDTKTESFGEDYEAKERVYAAYGMIHHDIGRLMLLAGLRFESTHINYKGSLVVLDGTRFDTIRPLTDSRQHNFLLPQFQAKYKVNDLFNLRAGVTATYSRPNFDDVLPYREEDRDEVKFGNPDLKYPRATNLDLLAERYWKSGFVTAGVFYKKIDDFVYFYKRFAHEGDPSDFGLVEITKAINGNKAEVMGVEIQAQSKFVTLPGLLRNFGVYVNYTFTHSDAYIYKRFPANFTDAQVVFERDDLSFYFDTSEEEKISLPGQARHTANFSLFFDSPRLLVRLTANYHDAFLYQLGADSDLDEYYDEEWRLDLNANFDLTKTVNFYVDVNNILDTPLRFYLGEPSRVKQQEFYSWKARIGCKLNF